MPLQKLAGGKLTLIRSTLSTNSSIGHHLTPDILLIPFGSGKSTPRCLTLEFPLEFLPCDIFLRYLDFLKMIFPPQNNFLFENVIISRRQTSLRSTGCAIETPRLSAHRGVFLFADHYDGVSSLIYHVFVDDMQFLLHTPSPLLASFSSLPLV